MFYIEIAKLLIRVENKYDYLKEVCKDYIVEPYKEEDAWFGITDEEIQFSYEWHLKYDGEKVSLPYAEYTQAHQKLYAHLAKYDAFWVHASVIGMDGFSYIFTAPSGYGKSTHAHIWQKVFGEKAKIINGDNPIIRKLEDGKFYAFGTPFGGKANEQVNIGLPLKGLCFLQHCDKNIITNYDKIEARNNILLNMFDFKIIRKNNFVKLLTLIEDFVENVKIYKLECNMEDEAAIVAYEGMK